jgi:hypothetical protein
VFCNRSPASRQESDSVGGSITSRSPVSASAARNSSRKLVICALAQALEDALALIDLATAPYLTASPTERRLINLAIYVMLIVCHNPDGVGIEPNAVFAELITLTRQLDRERASSAGRRSQANRDPLSLGRGSQLGQMAERAGFEPAMEFDPHTRLAGECLQPLGHLSWDEAGKSRGCRAVPGKRVASAGTEGWQSG